MAISTHYHNGQKILNILVEGDFTLSQYNEFRQSYEKQDKPEEKYLVDLRETHYIDSTALGMLLELRKFAKRHELDVQVANMNDVVLELFKIMNFHKIFKPCFTSDYYRSRWSE